MLTSFTDLGLLCFEIFRPGANEASAADDAKRLNDTHRDSRFIRMKQAPD
jgi:hypothetical protein